MGYVSPPECSSHPIRKISILDSHAYSRRIDEVSKGVEDTDFVSFVSQPP
jgi:hypothetical protein